MTTSKNPHTPFGLRLLAISIDWVLCLMISSAAFPKATVQDPTGIERVFLQGDPWATLAIWAVQYVVLVSTLGFTIGKRIAGIRVRRRDGSALVGLPKAAIRAGLTMLLVPAVSSGPDGVMLHDRIAKTFQERMKHFQ